MAGFDLRQIENVVDDFEEMLAAAEDVARIFLIFRFAQWPEKIRNP